MLLDKSSLDYINLESVVNTKVMIVNINQFDLELISKKMVNNKFKFVVVNNNEKSVILSSSDILSLVINNNSIFDFLKNKNVEILDSNTKIGDFLLEYENNSYRYYVLSKDKKIIGIIDKKEIIYLYRKIDDRNNTLISSILDNINDAVCIVDVECKVKFWNKSAEELYEITHDKIMNNKLTDYFPTALLPKVLLDEKKVMNVYNLPRENCHNLISASPLYSGDTLIGAISYDKDISEQIKIAENLKITESNIQVLEKELKNIGEERYSFDNIIGKNYEWLEIVKLTKMISKSMINVLISGESGTGKEVLARAIHVESKRKGLFVPINCSAIPKDLFESELFGYISGAFSGASTKGRVGKFEFATKGTIFLDEIGDMPLDMQAKLLRVIENQRVTPVGGNNHIEIDVRIISASNKNLLDLSNKGEFRKDLYFRLNGIGVELQPLRERKDDIVLLVNKFLNDYKNVYNITNLEIPSKILLMLENYDWEGNIRELKNIIERIVILSKNNNEAVVLERYLPNIIRDMSVQNKRIKEVYDLKNLVERTEKEAIKNVLLESTTMTEAAKLLGIPRSTLYFKLDKYNLRHMSKC